VWFRGLNAGFSKRRPVRAVSCGFVLNKAAALEKVSLLVNLGFPCRHRSTLAPCEHFIHLAPTLYNLSK
jgi:hypothetical protein